MSRLSALTLGLLFTGLVAVAIRSDDARLALAREMSVRELQRIQADDSLPVSPARMGLRAFQGDVAELSSYQGIEVHLEALRWDTTWFAAREDHGVGRYGGFARFDLNQILFDPDLPARGLPDVRITAGDVAPAPGGLYAGTVAGRLLGRRGREAPVESTVWPVEDSAGNVRKLRMDTYVLEFDLAVEIVPTIDGRDEGGYPRDAVDPFTGRRLRDLGEEDDEYRYGNLTVLLRVTPKRDTWYVASREDGRWQANESPAIGIAAVEVVELEYRGDPQDEVPIIGAHLLKGQSLAMHSDPEAAFGLPRSVRRDEVLRDVSDLRARFQELARTRSAVLNPALFGADRYSVVHVSNVGTWREGSWIRGRREWADQIRVTFAVHAFVVGEWRLRRTDRELELSEQIERHRAGLVDYLPSFGLPGWLGKPLFSGFLALGLVLVLGALFPPLLAIVNLLLGVVARVLQGVVGSPARS